MERASRASESRALAALGEAKASFSARLLSAREAAAAANAARSVAERERHEVARALTSLEEHISETEKRANDTLAELEVVRASESFLRGEVVAREVRLERAKDAATAAKAETERGARRRRRRRRRRSARLDEAEAAAYWRVRDLEDELEAERAGRRADAAKRAAGAGAGREE